MSSHRNNPREIPLTVQLPWVLVELPHVDVHHTDPVRRVSAIGKPSDGNTAPGPLQVLVFTRATDDDPMERGQLPEGNPHLQLHLKRPRNIVAGEFLENLKIDALRRCARPLDQILGAPILTDSS